MEDKANYYHVDLPRAEITCFCSGCLDKDERIRELEAERDRYRKSLEDICNKAKNARGLAADLSEIAWKALRGE